MFEVNSIHAYPDIRFLLSPKANGEPLLAIIFPWETVEIEPKDKFECHIDFFKKYSYPQNDRRFQQKQVCDIKKCPFKFNASVSFYYPNLVFESDLFEERVVRLTVPLSDFDNLGYPLHLKQYIGFESKDRVTISGIKIKELII